MICGKNSDFNPPFDSSDGVCNLCAVDPSFADDSEVCFKLYAYEEAKP